MKTSQVEFESSVQYSLLAQNKPLKCNKVIFRLLIFSAFFSIIITQINISNHITQHVPACETIDLSLTSYPSQSFPEQMRSFPWEQYRNAVNANDISAIQSYTELLFTSILIPFTIKEPVHPINSSCQATPIWEPEKIDKCTRLNFPRKVGVILNFGFDVDALELHLHELDSLVGKFFLMEGTKIHNRYLSTKPSIWDMIKYTPRFSQFRDKIVHFIIDDSEYASTEIAENSETILPELWDRENLQKKIRLEKFLKWNTASNYFGPQDIIGIGDADEIPNRNVVNFLKSCELQSENVRIGSWFPFPYIDTIFASYLPISGHPFTFSTPVYSTITALPNSLTKVGIEMGTINDEFILGGLHFSKYLYLPFQFLKMITGTESELRGLNDVIESGFIYKSMARDNHKSLEQVVAKVWIDKWNWLANRIKSVDWFRMKYGDQEANAIIRLPWFYECNPERFPSFHRKPNQRLA